MRKPYLECGKVVGTHGVNGEVRVQPWCDSPTDFKGKKRLYLDERGEKFLTVESVRPHKSLVLIRFAGVSDLDAAEDLRGRTLYFARADIAIPEGAYLIQDLQGCRVVDADSGREYGTLADVSRTGANDVWHIEKDGKETLIPAIPDVVVDVDIDAGIIQIRPIAGLFDAED